MKTYQDEKQRERLSKTKKHKMQNNIKDMDEKDAKVEIHLALHRNRQ